MAPNKPSGPSITAQDQQNSVSEGIENYELPKSLVVKIAKSSIPDNIKLQKETVVSLVKGSTVFINYLAATAHDVAQSRQHKSISASDVLKALEMMQFGDMSNKLQNELTVYRDIMKYGDHLKTKKGTNGSGSAAKKSGNASSASAKGKGRERIVAANPYPPPPPFTSEPHLSLAGNSGRPESISGTGTGEPMDVDRWNDGDMLDDDTEAAPVGDNMGADIVISDDEKSDDLEERAERPAERPSLEGGVDQ